MAINVVKVGKNVFPLIDIIIDIIFFSINWKNYFDRSILVISMTVLDESSLSIGRVKPGSVLGVGKSIYGTHLSQPITYCSCPTIYSGLEI